MKNMKKKKKNIPKKIGKNNYNNTINILPKSK